MKKNKIFIFILSLVTLIFIFNSSFSRYIYNKVRNSIFESQKFYFNSTVLKENGENYNISDWDGVNPYELTIDVTGQKNDFISSTSDIEYMISLDCPSTVICTLSKTTGIIYSDVKTDSYTITVTPIESFYEGDSVSISTSATSTSPYKKTIKATYTIEVQNFGFSYDIADSQGSKYVELNLTNSKPYYEVLEPFENYNKGDLVPLEVYNSLSDENKIKCISTQVEIAFDPNYLYLDLTNESYLKSINSTTTLIDGYVYVNGITLNLDATSNTKILFFKKDINTNYENTNHIEVKIIK